MITPIKHALFKFSLILLAMVVTACSPVTLLNGVIPTDGYLLNKDIAFGDLDRQILDVYIPKHNDKKPMPVVLFFYGGGWDSGQKKDYLFAAEAFTSKGYLTVIPDYRLFPEVKFPAFMYDAAEASKWVKTHIAEYGGDPDNVFIVGHSAGAHISIMLDLNAEYFDSVNLNSNQFNGFVGLAGPYDFLPFTTKRLKDIFGPASSWWQSQPINFVTGKNQPTLLMVGLKDETVLPSNTFHLADAIKANNGPVKVVTFPDYDHVDMISNIAKPFRGNSNLLDEIVLFIEANRK
jgi:acetyl esterase/lipase